MRPEDHVDKHDAPDGYEAKPTTALFPYECDGCALQDLPGGCGSRLEGYSCIRSDREDDLNVIFVKAKEQKNAKRR